MTFLFEIWRGTDDLLITAELVYVNADPRTKQAAPLPEDLRKRVLGYEKLAPAQ
jgi:acyl-CoA thioester hydrolase